MVGKGALQSPLEEIQIILQLQSALSHPPVTFSLLCEKSHARRALLTILLLSLHERTSIPSAFQFAPLSLQEHLISLRPLLMALNKSTFWGLMGTGCPALNPLCCEHLSQEQAQRENTT